MTVDLSNRQAAAGRQGAAFEATVELLLQIEGWTIDARRWRQPDVDVEIDLVATDPDGVQWWIECKGSWESDRNGLARTDTLKKAIGSAYSLSRLPKRRPYMVVASHLPKTGAGVGWIDDLLSLCAEIRVVGFVQTILGTSQPSQMEAS